MKNELQAPVQFTDAELQEIATIDRAGYGVDSELLDDLSYQLNNQEWKPIVKSYRIKLSNIS